LGIYARSPSPGPAVWEFMQDQETCGPGFGNLCKILPPLWRPLSHDGIHWRLRRSRALYSWGACVSHRRPFCPLWVCVGYGRSRRKTVLVATRRTTLADDNRARGPPSVMETNPRACRSHTASVSGTKAAGMQHPGRLPVPAHDHTPGRRGAVGTDRPIARRYTGIETSAEALMRLINRDTPGLHQMAGQ